MVYVWCEVNISLEEISTLGRECTGARKGSKTQEPELCFCFCFSQSGLLTSNLTRLVRSDVKFQLKEVFACGKKKKKSKALMQTKQSKFFLL